MNIEQALIRMAEAPGCEIQLYYYHWVSPSNIWGCTVTSKSEGTEIKITATGTTPAEAVQGVWDKFSRPGEISDVLMGRQIEPPRHEPPPYNDEIPF